MCVFDIWGNLQVQACGGVLDIRGTNGDELDGRHRAGKFLQVRRGLATKVARYLRVAS